jgi:hypothetical protein
LYGQCQESASIPNQADIANEEDFKAAICRDHVSAEYKNFHRSNADYIAGNVGCHGL